MQTFRKVVAYGNHFERFLKTLPPKIQDKIFKIIEAMETLQRIPSHYLKLVNAENKLYEARIQLGSNQWRVFCFFEEERLIILMHGFQKKSQKVPRKEIQKAIQLIKQYYEEKAGHKK
jgi:phage-related protein